MKRLLILGAGGHGKVVAEAALASKKWTQLEFIDARHPALGRVLDWPVIGKDTEATRFLDDYPECAVAVGDNRTRVALVAALANAGFRIPAIVHSHSSVSPSAHIGDGTVIVAGAIINASARLGRGCIVNTGATVDHDCYIGDGVHISPGAHVGGETVIGERTWIGIGAAVRHRVKIGADVIVGAGAAVVEDLADGVTVVGVPARRV